MILTQEQVRVMLRNQTDLGPKDCRIGSAIAMCEAPAYGAATPSADFSLVGDVELANETWGYSYGGFQVRSLREEKGTGGWRDEEWLIYPRFNCQAAAAIRHDSGWRAWSTFVDGKYKAYLQDLFPPPPNTYVVLGGDTLSGIGAKLGIDWTELARVNNLHSPYTIFIGQHLVIP